MEITITQLIILALATFRMTRLFVYDKITEPLRRPFFDEIEEEGEIYLQPKGFIGTLLSCHWCTGFWCSIITVILFFNPYLEFFAVILAVAGLASLIQWVMDRA
jgi:hypothetical protein